MFNILKTPIYWEPIKRTFKEVTEEDKMYMLDIMCKVWGKDKSKLLNLFTRDSSGNYTVLSFINYKFDNERQIEFGIDNDEFRVDLDAETFEMTTHSCF